MLHKKMRLNNSASLHTYILDGEISYQTKRKRPAIIICPGGGYLMTATKEGEAVAAEFMGRGYHTFVLRYSTYFKERMTDVELIPSINKEAQYPQQVIELAEAMHILHENADEWNIDTGNIFIMGFSAGGHITASLGNQWNKESFTEMLSFMPKGEELRPKGLVLGYPMLHGCSSDYVIQNAHKDELIKHQTRFVEQALFGTNHPTDEQVREVNMMENINEDTPSTFIWSLKNDRVLDTKMITQYVLQLMEHGISCEYHLFEQGEHGLGLANELYATREEEINLDVNMWVDLASNWLKFQMEK